MAAAALLALAGPFFLPGVALAHDAPDEGPAAWLMADWMLLSFLVFFLAALTVFVVALRRGMLANLEDAKYHILSIDEQDYYTPDWAKEGTDASER
jgi:hypothetical protein